MISVQPQTQPKMNRQNESAFFERILSSVNASIYILNLDPFRVEWINDSLHTLRGTGMRANQIIKEGAEVPYRLIESPDFEENLIGMRDFFYKNPDDRWHGIFRLKHESGSYRWIFATANIYEKEPNGIPQNALATAFDVSDLLHTNRSLAVALQEIQQQRHKGVIDNLTKREIEIIQLLAQGQSTKEIADTLNRSFHTIETHRGNIKNKLGCKNVAEIASVAYRIGLTI